MDSVNKTRKEGFFIFSLHIFPDFPFLVRRINAKPTWPWTQMNFLYFSPPLNKSSKRYNWDDVEGFILQGSTRPGPTRTLRTSLGKTVQNQKIRLGFLSLGLVEALRRIERERERT